MFKKFINLDALWIKLLAEVYRPGETRVAASLHYFYGDCNSSEVQQQIKENFIKLLNESFFSEACQDEALKDKCKAENVVVTCGNVTRRRRSAGTLVLQARFHFTLGRCAFIKPNFGERRQGKYRTSLPGYSDNIECRMYPSRAIMISIYWLAKIYKGK